MSDSPWPTTAPQFRGPSEPKKVSLSDALPPDTRLDEFEIVDVLGTGAFGIVYLARDRLLLRQVAIKEYVPATLAGRRDGLALSLRSPDFAPTFERGLESFLSEAQLLASFDHPSLVKVHRFWRGNGTAYMAMPHYPGETLKAVRARMDGAPQDAWVRALLQPLLGVLELLHSQGVLHRDVSPDNILILPDGSPVLLDLGSARRVIGDGTAFLTTLLKPPFAPLEQYAQDDDVRQGPWTDLYSLGATLHYVLAGQPPTPSVVRAVADVLPTLASLPRPPTLSSHEQLLATIDWMLALAPEARPRDVESVRRALRGELVPPVSRTRATGLAEPHAPSADPPANPGERASAPVEPDRWPASEREQAAATSDTAAAFATDDGSERARRDTPRRDARATVTLMALLGLAVLLGGAWTLDGAGRTSPALASLSSALGASSRAHVSATSSSPPRDAATSRPAPWPAAGPQTVAGSRTATPPLPSPELHDAAVIAAQPETRAGSTTGVTGTASPAVAPPAPAAPATTSVLASAAEPPIAAGAPVLDSASPERSAASAHAAERRGARSRAVHPVGRGQVQSVTARARFARAGAGCDASGVLAQFMCAIRQCNSARSSAAPECARNRRIEEARARRVERL